jgi:NADH:ubiquinone oxidoreductase subunit
MRFQHRPARDKPLVDGGGPPGYGPALTVRPRVSLLLKRIFTWWNGATVGTLFTIRRLGVKVGSDQYGNTYFEAKTNKNSYDGRKRRWVVYDGYADASKVPPEWFGWLHHTLEDVPTPETMPRHAWQREHRPNMSGTPLAWRPRGSIARGGERARATGDYQAWKPD